MKTKISQTIIELFLGDITLEETDAIVNAANSRLAGGAGVDGAIHSAGGPSIMAECRKIGGCPTGQAVITAGGNLAARYVIHTVGPVYRGGGHNEAGLLASAYQNSLKLAVRHGLKSIAFPAISCGIYGYPVSDAAHVALKICFDFARENADLEKIRHVLFDQRTYDLFELEFKKLI
ncbi:MAG: O-acetyl-ADP-ribose deacetylase [Syntrophaceae bacterium]|nr:O-acetyl-ADP-ribose deacetylase [Syntrophaceae bacterium]HOC61063.1 O-acetyl-ADP-ribose deacetylase [Smithellaceae bacterium]HQM46182.1 O-acetyl-ADP-ribose deacetylase [Smithellaceae bacterium]